MTYRTSLRADDDLANIYVEGAVMFDPAQADRYQDGLFATFEMLAHNPLMARGRGELRPPVRLYPHQAHVIVYIEDDPGILIIRVLHGRQDWESALA